MQYDGTADSRPSLGVAFVWDSFFACRTYETCTTTTNDPVSNTVPRLSCDPTPETTGLDTYLYRKQTLETRVHPWTPFTTGSSLLHGAAAADIRGTGDLTNVGALVDGVLRNGAANGAWDSATGVGTGCDRACESTGTDAAAAATCAGAVTIESTTGRGEWYVTSAGDVEVSSDPDLATDIQIENATLQANDHLSAHSWNASMYAERQNDLVVLRTADGRYIRHSSYRITASSARIDAVDRLASTWYKLDGWWGLGTVAFLSTDYDDHFIMFSANTQNLRLEFVAPGATANLAARESAWTRNDGNRYVCTAGTAAGQCDASAARFQSTVTFLSTECSDCCNIAPNYHVELPLVAAAHVASVVLWNDCVGDPTTADASFYDGYNFAYANVYLITEFGIRRECGSVPAAALCGSATVDCTGIADRAAAVRVETKNRTFGLRIAEIEAFDALSTECEVVYNLTDEVTSAGQRTGCSTCPTVTQYTEGCFDSGDACRCSLETPCAGTGGAADCACAGETCVAGTCRPVWLAEEACNVIDSCNATDPDSAGAAGCTLSSHHTLSMAFTTDDTAAARANLEHAMVTCETSCTDWCCQVQEKRSAQGDGTVTQTFTCQGSQTYRTVSQPRSTSMIRPGATGKANGEACDRHSGCNSRFCDRTGFQDTWVCADGAALSGDVASTGAAVGSIRLTNGPNARAGRVEILRADMTWGTICDDRWSGGQGQRNAEVACRELGFGGGAAFSTAYFGHGTGTITYDEMVCEGTETSLANCPSDGVDVTDCSHAEDVGVQCNDDTGGFQLRLQTAEASSTYANPSGWVTCADAAGSAGGGNNTCACDSGWSNSGTYAIRYGCNNCGGFISDDDNDDDDGMWVEQRTVAASMECSEGAFGGDPAIGLSGDRYCQCATSWDTVAFAGRVEVYVPSNYSTDSTKQGWSTVCADSFWSTIDARTVCAQLGFVGGEIETYDTMNDRHQVGTASQPILMREVDCLGDEDALWSCGTSGFFDVIVADTRNCEHTQDAGVRCTPPTHAQLIADGATTPVPTGDEQFTVFLNATYPRHGVFAQARPGRRCSDSHLLPTTLAQCAAYGASQDFVTFDAAYVAATEQVRFEGASDQDCSWSSPTLSIVTTVSDCKSRCADNAACVGFTYQPSTTTCELLAGLIGCGGAVGVDLYTKTGCQPSNNDCQAGALRPAESGCVLDGATLYFVDDSTERDCNDDRTCICIMSQVEVDPTAFVDSYGVRYGGRVVITGPDQLDPTVIKEFSVCDDGWDLNDAKVVCRQLGLTCETSTCRALSGTENSVYFSWNSAVANGFQTSSAQILLDDVSCSGSETSLLSCRSANSETKYASNCNQNEDAGVICDLPGVPAPEPTVSPTLVADRLDCVPAFEPCGGTGHVGHTMCPEHFACRAWAGTAPTVDACDRSALSGSARCTCEPSTTDHQQFFGSLCTDACYGSSNGHSPLDATTGEAATIEGSAGKCQARCGNVEYAASWAVAHGTSGGAVDQTLSNYQDTDQANSRVRNQSAQVYSRAPPDAEVRGLYRWCSADGQTCHCDGTVRFGAASLWTYRRMQGSVTCSSGQFTDPVVGTTKHCECRPAQYENEQYWQVSGSKVLAGASASKATFTIVDGRYQLGDSQSVVEAASAYRDIQIGPRFLVSFRLADGTYLTDTGAGLAPAVDSATAAFRIASSFYMLPDKFHAGSVAFMSSTKNENYVMHRYNQKNEMVLHVGTVCSRWSWFSNTGSCHLAGSATGVTTLAATSGSVAKSGDPHCDTRHTSECGVMACEVSEAGGVCGYDFRCNASDTPPPTMPPTAVPSTNRPTVLPSRSPSMTPSTVPSRSPTADTCRQFGCSRDCVSGVCGWDSEGQVCAAGYTTTVEEADAHLETTAGACSHHTRGPSEAPSQLPSTSTPTRSPSSGPTSSSPTSNPSKTPSVRPSIAPSPYPSTQAPTGGPTLSPSSSGPSRAPSNAPSRRPSTSNPTRNPTRDPTGAPTVDPCTTNYGCSRDCTGTLGLRGSFQVVACGWDLANNICITNGDRTEATRRALYERSTGDCSHHTSAPTQVPSRAPSVSPTTHLPTTAPSDSPTGLPSTFCRPDGMTTCPGLFSRGFCATPEIYAICTTSCNCESSYGSFTGSPTASPTPRSASPTDTPSATPTYNPSTTPTRWPTISPSGSPTTSPTKVPTLGPSISPSASPTRSPTDSPSKSPTRSPTDSPTISPSSSPSLSPSGNPTRSPSSSPTRSPTDSPTISPSYSPTDSPSNSPTDSPSNSPSKLPSVSPTVTPTGSPTETPTTSPSTAPTESPTKGPSKSPTASPTRSPTVTPTVGPTKGPTTTPTLAPSVSPTVNPTKAPTVTPSISPSHSPTVLPTVSPSMFPTVLPTASPSLSPSMAPTTSPSTTPSSSPTLSPSIAPTLSPSTAPSTSPSTSPTASPSASPTMAPTSSPVDCCTYMEIDFNMTVATDHALIEGNTRSASAIAAYRFARLQAWAQFLIMACSAERSASSDVAFTFDPAGASPDIGTHHGQTYHWDNSTVLSYTQGTVRFLYLLADNSLNVTEGNRVEDCLNGRGALNNLDLGADGQVVLVFNYSTHTRIADAPTRAPTRAPAPTLRPTSFAPSPAPSVAPSRPPSGANEVNTLTLTCGGDYAPLWESGDIDPYETSVLANINSRTSATVTSSTAQADSRRGSVVTVVSFLPSSGMTRPENLRLEASLVANMFSITAGGATYVCVAAEAGFGTLMPTMTPTVPPTANPTKYPTTNPTGTPTVPPTSAPSDSPSDSPSSSPSESPSHSPTKVPTDSPSKSPTRSPTSSPSNSPTDSPSNSPSSSPSTSPSGSPSRSPSDSPSKSPTRSPSSSPSSSPSISPSDSPSSSPSTSPSGSPSRSPSDSPSKSPTRSPSNSPSNSPSISPSDSPSSSPSTSPTDSPSRSPSISPTIAPSESPSNSPSTSPSASPSVSPSGSPSMSPSSSPSRSPSNSPSTSPSTSPSGGPSMSPSTSPTNTPTQIPSDSPSASPSSSPSITPSASPTESPSTSPSNTPSRSPTVSPSHSPSRSPSTSPSMSPSTSPTDVTSNVCAGMSCSRDCHGFATEPITGARFMCGWDLELNLCRVGFDTSELEREMLHETHAGDCSHHTGAPTITPYPTSSPTSFPTVSPTASPSGSPTGHPTSTPTVSPSLAPSMVPTRSPTSGPTRVPTLSPTSGPTLNPTKDPTRLPTRSPFSTRPTRNPTPLPTRNPTTSVPTPGPTSEYCPYVKLFFGGSFDDISGDNLTQIALQADFTAQISREIGARRTSLATFTFADVSSTVIEAGETVVAGGDSRGSRSRGILVTLQFPTGKLADANAIEEVAFNLNTASMTVDLGSTSYTSTTVLFNLDYCPGVTMAEGPDGTFSAVPPTAPTTPPPTCPYIESTYTCTAGQYLYIDQRDFSQYRCEECPANSYQSEKGHTIQSCKPYNQDLCPPGQKLVSDRSKTQDRQCATCDGIDTSSNSVQRFQPAPNFTATECLTVRSCSRGEYELEPPTLATNRVCHSCTAGTYQDDPAFTGDRCRNCPFGKYSDDGAYTCTDHTTCRTNETEFVFEAGTSVADTICKSCMAGQYYKSQDITSLEQPTYLDQGAHTLCRGPGFSFNNHEEGTMAEQIGIIITTTWPKTRSYNDTSAANQDRAGCEAICTADPSCRAYGIQGTTCSLYAHQTLVAEATDMVSQCFIRQDRSRDCVECPINTYRTTGEHNFVNCLAVSTCGPGQKETMSPWPDADRQCASCAPDSFMPEIDHTNTACNVPTNCEALGLEEISSSTLTSDTVCASAPAASSSLANDSTGSLTSALLGAAALMAVVIGLLLFKLQKKNNTPLDFGEELATLDEEFPNLAIEDIAAAGPGEPRTKPREIVRKDVWLLDMLGHGAFGEVYKAVLSEKGTLSYTIAVKTLKTEDEDASKEFMQEAMLMVQFEHPNVSGILGVVTVGNPALVCLQFMENGELLKFLQKHSGFRVLTDGALLQICHDVVSGMDYLHERRIMHRDLAARNILVDALYVCQIADFGLSRHVPNNKKYLKIPGKFPARWTALEAYNHKYSLQSDIWAYGILAYEVYTSGAKPYLGKTNDEAMRAIKGGFRLACPMDCSPEVYAGMMAPCWHEDPAQRPTFKEMGIFLGNALKDATGKLKQQFGKQRLASMKRVNVKNKKKSTKKSRDIADENEYVMAADSDAGSDDEADYTLGGGLDELDFTTYNDDVDDNLYTDAADDDPDQPKSFFEENDYTQAADSEDGGENDYTEAADSEDGEDATGENDYAEAADSGSDDAENDYTEAAYGEAEA